ncbi:MAG: zinc metalloprotease HtpX [Chthonomonadales bacterium]|nr:zinc metalloprotease HtpX [Chthonomonadales bacterium]
MNTLKTGILMAGLFGLFMVLGRVFGGTAGLLLGFAFALATNFFAYWFSDRVALSMSGAKAVDEAQAPGLYRMVRRLAQSAGLPMPSVHIIPSAQPNAFATGRDPNHAAVAVTEGLLRSLDEEELEGVLAHELAHVQHRDILISSIAATFAGAITLLVHVLQIGMLFGGLGRSGDDGEGTNPLAALAAIIFAPLAAMVIQLAISRSREYEADRGGAIMSGKPLALASALRRIEHAVEQRPMQVSPASSHMFIINPLGGDAVRSLAALFRTHPLTEERIARLQAMAHDIGGRARQATSW